MNSDPLWQNSTTRRVVSLLPIVAFSVFIFIASSIPADELPEFAFTWSDKVLHTLAFFVYGITCQIAVVGYKPMWSVGRIRLVSFTIGAAYGMFDELHQYFVPSRDSSILDWIADLFGLALALFLTRFLRTLFRF